jgi:DNA-binding MarR family transcriptional regulator
MSGAVDINVLAFEEKHLISIMMFLSVNGECRKIEIYENVSSNPRIPDKLDRLEALGLITQTPRSDSRSITIGLTEKGKAVAAHFVELDKIIKSN